MLSFRNWDFFDPSPAGEYAPPPFGTGGRGTLAGEKGGGRVPIPTRGHTLWYSVPSNLLISSGGINFVTPTANFFLHLLDLLHKISKNFKNKLSFKYFSLLMLFYAKKWFI